MKIVYWVSLILALSLALIYLFQENYPHFMFFFSNAFPPVIAGAAVATSGFALRRYWEDLRSRLSRVWLFFTLGMVLWFLGELGWATYRLILNVEKPYPSIADVFWLSGYVPLFLALYIYVQIFKPAISRQMLRIAEAMVSILSIAIYSLLLPPIIEAAEDPVVLFVDLAYPTLDIPLFAMAILGLLIFTMSRLKGKIGTAWLLINSGILMNVVGDVLFSYATLLGTYWEMPAHPLELFFHWGYLLFLLAFYTHMKEL